VLKIKSFKNDQQTNKAQSSKLNKNLHEQRNVNYF